MKARYFGRVFGLIMIGLMPLQLMAQDFISSRHYWEDGALTWDDYLGKPNQSISKEMSFIRIGYSARLGKIKKGHTTYLFPEFYPFMSRYDSWVVDSARTDSRLLYDQTLLDLSELYCRKATKEYNTSSSEVDGDELFDFYYNQMRKRFNELDEKTDTGKIALALEEYYDYVQYELAKEVFDPIAIAEERPREAGIGMYFGYNLRAPLSGEFTPTHGITLGWDFPIRRSILGFDVNLEGFGWSRTYINTSKGPITYGEKVRSGSLDVYYGLNVFRNGTLSLYPFAGVGVTFYDGEYYTNDDGQRTSNEIAAFTQEIGVNVDVILHSSVRLFSRGRTSTTFTSMRFRPSLSLPNMKQKIGRMPTLNLSVSFNFTGQ